jgi:hypothetical protein
MGLAERFVRSVRGIDSLDCILTCSKQQVGLVDSLNMRAKVNQYLTTLGGCPTRLFSADGGVIKYISKRADLVLVYDGQLVVARVSMVDGESMDEELLVDRHRFDFRGNCYEGYKLLDKLDEIFVLEGYVSCLDFASEGLPEIKRRYGRFEEEY